MRVKSYWIEIIAALSIWSNYANTQGANYYVTSPYHWNEQPVARKNQDETSAAREPTLTNTTNTRANIWTTAKQNSNNRSIHIVGNDKRIFDIKYQIKNETSSGGINAKFYFCNDSNIYYLGNLNTNLKTLRDKVCNYCLYFYVIDDDNKFCSKKCIMIPDSNKCLKVITNNEICHNLCQKCNGTDGESGNENNALFMCKNVKELNEVVGGNKNNIDIHSYNNNDILNDNTKITDCEQFNSHENETEWHNAYYKHFNVNLPKENHMIHGPTHALYYVNNDEAIPENIISNAANDEENKKYRLHLKINEIKNDKGNIADELSKNDMHTEISFNSEPKTNICNSTLNSNISVNYGTTTKNADKMADRYNIHNAILNSSEFIDATNDEEHLASNKNMKYDNVFTRPENFFSSLLNKNQYYLENPNGIITLTHANPFHFKYNSTLDFNVPKLEVHDCNTIYSPTTNYSIDKEYNIGSENIVNQNLLNVKSPNLVTEGLKAAGSYFKPQNFTKYLPIKWSSNDPYVRNLITPLELHNFETPTKTNITSRSSTFPYMWHPNRKQSSTALQIPFSNQIPPSIIPFTTDATNIEFFYPNAKTRGEILSSKAIPQTFKSILDPYKFSHCEKINQKPLNFASMYQNYLPKNINTENLPPSNTRAIHKHNILVSEPLWKSKNSISKYTPLFTVPYVTLQYETKPELQMSNLSIPAYEQCMNQKIYEKSIPQYAGKQFKLEDLSYSPKSWTSSNNVKTRLLMYELPKQIIEASNDKLCPQSTKFETSHETDKLLSNAWSYLSPHQRNKISIRNPFFQYYRNTSQQTTSHVDFFKPKSSIHPKPNKYVTPQPLLDVIEIPEETILNSKLCPSNRYIENLRRTAPLLNINDNKQKITRYPITEYDKTLELNNKSSLKENIKEIFSPHSYNNKRYVSNSELQESNQNPRSNFYVSKFRRQLPFLTRIIGSNNENFAKNIYTMPDSCTFKNLYMIDENNKNDPHTAALFKKNRNNFISQVDDNNKDNSLNTRTLFKKQNVKDHPMSVVQLFDRPTQNANFISNYTEPGPTYALNFEQKGSQIPSIEVKPKQFKQYLQGLETEKNPSFKETKTIIDPNFNCFTPKFENSRADICPTMGNKPLQFISNMPKNIYLRNKIKQIDPLGNKINPLKILSLKEENVSYPGEYNKYFQYGELYKIPKLYDNRNSYDYSFNRSSRQKNGFIESSKVITSPAIKHTNYNVPKISETFLQPKISQESIVPLNYNNLLSTSSPTPVFLTSPKFNSDSSIANIVTPIGFVSPLTNRNLITNTNIRPNKYLTYDNREPTSQTLSNLIKDPIINLPFNIDENTVPKPPQKVEKMSTTPKNVCNSASLATNPYGNLDIIPKINTLNDIKHCDKNTANKIPFTGIYNKNENLKNRLTVAEPNLEILNKKYDQIVENFAPQCLKSINYNGQNKYLLPLTNNYIPKIVPSTFNSVLDPQIKILNEPKSDDPKTNQGSLFYSSPFESTLNKRTLSPINLNSNFFKRNILPDKSFPSILSPPNQLPSLKSNTYFSTASNQKDLIPQEHRTSDSLVTYPSNRLGNTLSSASLSDINDKFVPKYNKESEVSTSSPKSLNLASYKTTDLPTSKIYSILSKGIEDSEITKDNLYNIPNGITIDLGNIGIAKYECKTPEKQYYIQSDNPDIELRTWKSKLRIVKAKLLLQTEELEATNFMPIVKKCYDPTQAQNAAKNIITRIYGEPIVIRGVYSYYRPYAVIRNMNEIYLNRGKCYILWPTFCNCGCQKSGCNCFFYGNHLCNNCNHRLDNCNRFK